jgi:hypothetical protein
MGIPLFESTTNAAKMLLGDSDEKDNWLVEKRVTDVVVVPSNNLLTVSLSTLLTMEDPDIKVYNIGRDLFMNCLEEDDLLANTPLEAAYIWSLLQRKNRLIFYDGDHLKWIARH